MKDVLIILCMALLAGCSRHVIPQQSIVSEDSTITKIEYRDTVIRIPAKTVEVIKMVPGNCPDFDTTVKKGNTTVSLSKKGNRLKVDCHEDSLKMVIKALNWRVERMRNVVQQVPVNVEVPKPYIPRWVWWTMGALLTAAAWGNRKLIIRLIKLITGLWA